MCSVRCDVGWRYGVRREEHACVHGVSVDVMAVHPGNAAGGRRVVRDGQPDGMHAVRHAVYVRRLAVLGQTVRALRGHRGRAEAVCGDL